MAQNLPAVQKAANIRALLEKSRKQLEMALPKHMTADRLLRVAMTSIQRTPKLLDCTQTSLLACIMTCAQLGLEPDQFLGQAYLVPFKDTRKGVLTCTLIPGYRGYIALARRSGEVQSVSAQVVYSKDHFSLQYGIEERLEHVPYEPDEKELEGRNPRGDFRGAYVIFKYKDGSYSFDYMNKAEIDRIRKRSKSSDDGPWVTDYDEMAKKTVIKRHVKLAPLSVEFARAAALEDRAMLGESQSDLLGMEEAGEDDVIDTEAIEADLESLLKSFADSIPEGTDQTILDDFLTRTAEGNKTTIDQVKCDAAKKPADFWRFYRAYEKQHKSKAKSDPKQNSQKTPAPLKDVFAGDPDDPEFAPDTCPDRPDEIMTKAFCDTKCVQRKGCPVWRGE